MILTPLISSPSPVLNGFRYLKSLTHTIRFIIGLLLKDQFNADIIAYVPIAIALASS